MLIQRKPAVVAGQRRTYAKGTAVTEAKGFVFLSGAIGMDTNTGKIPEGMREQTRLVMENIKARLEEYGSSLKNILIVRRYVKGEFPNGIRNDTAYQESYKETEEFWKENCPEFLGENNPPAYTLVGVTSLGLPELLIEIEVVAAIE
jgi:enamine deaminase RidA (YjgF/YER057c/UK114 family)